MSKLRTIMFVAGLMVAGMALRAAAQIEVSVASLKETVTCADGTVVTIAPQDPATANQNGDNVDAMGNDTVKVPCHGLLSGPLQIATIASARDEADAVDNSNQDTGEAKEKIQAVNILGGLFTYDSNASDITSTRMDNGQ